jgi:ABC-type nitrate/sulfonate/bicarbonate transport system permease component
MGEVLPGPVEVLGFIGREIENGRLAFHVGITTRRVLIAFAIALTAGVALGASWAAPSAPTTCSKAG